MCVNLKSVVIPAGVDEIGDYAFWGCDSLASITIGANVSIGIEAFDSCLGDFSAAYANKHCAAGVYEWNGKSWNLTGNDCDATPIR
jgi:hypothetical protein